MRTRPLRSDPIGSSVDDSFSPRNVTATDLLRASSKRSSQLQTIPVSSASPMNLFESKVEDSEIYLE
ncbi:unnamed protein product [Larinioides sclopetarius]|uniref:Uncharacterized protein n=1 Tax=Larinioides sclopetarius TaxID=280406 RepID=A0AAV2AQY9_9ARAC